VFLSDWKRSSVSVASRLSLQIGYYRGNMPRMVENVLTRAEDLYGDKSDADLGWIRRLPPPLYINQINEGQRNRNEQIEVPYTWQDLPSECVLQVDVDGVSIPWEGDPQWVPPAAPDIAQATRIELECEPSMLEYFFPYAREQALLSSAEKALLGSRSRAAIDNKGSLAAFSDEVSRGKLGGMVAKGSRGLVRCYRGDVLVESLVVYGDTDVETEGKDRFRYTHGLTGLRAAVPDIQPFEARRKCAVNLSNLWHRFRLYPRALRMGRKDGVEGVERGITASYPVPAQWCDEITTAYANAGYGGSQSSRMFRCPSMDEGRCHYAMNPACQPDSQADMVLLFETKDGWNQHGGPELFTFDNHDPNGGLALLNDGTVKFVRTEKELEQLRWK